LDVFLRNFWGEKFSFQVNLVIILSDQIKKITFLGFEQLQLILQKIGTPDDDAIDRIPSEKVLLICYLFVII